MSAAASLALGMLSPLRPYTAPIECASAIATDHVKIGAIANTEVGGEMAGVGRD